MNNFQQAMMQKQIADETELAALKGETNGN